MGSVEYTDDVRKELEKDYETALSTIDSEQVLDGSVVSITDREVIVNINYKSDGIISRNEFRYNEDLKVGDTVEVLVEKKEDNKGQLYFLTKKHVYFVLGKELMKHMKKILFLKDLLSVEQKVV